MDTLEEPIEEPVPDTQESEEEAARKAAEEEAARKAAEEESSQSTSDEPVEVPKGRRHVQHVSKRKHAW